MSIIKDKKKYYAVFSNKMADGCSVVILGPLGE